MKQNYIMTLKAFNQRLREDCEKLQKEVDEAEDCQDNEEMTEADLKATIQDAGEIRDIAGDYFNGDDIAKIVEAAAKDIEKIKPTPAMENSEIDFDGVWRSASQDVNDGYGWAQVCINKKDADKFFKNLAAEVKKSSDESLKNCVGKYAIIATCCDDPKLLTAHFGVDEKDLVKDMCLAGLSLNTQLATAEDDEPLEVTNEAFDGYATDSQLNLKYFKEFPKMCGITVGESEEEDEPEDDEEKVDEGEDDLDDLDDLPTEDEEDDLEEGESEEEDKPEDDEDVDESSTKSVMNKKK